MAQMTTGTTMTPRQDYTTSVNPLHILEQLNSGFQKSKREQIDRFLRDQDDLNRRFSDENLASGAEAGDDDDDASDTDDVESEFNMRLDTFRVRPLSARIGSWVDDSVTEAIATNDPANAEVANRLSVISNTDDDSQRSRLNGRNGRNPAPINTTVVNGITSSSGTSKDDPYTKFARNRDRSTSRERKTGLDVSLRKRASERSRAMDKSRERGTSRDRAAGKENTSHNPEIRHETAQEENSPAGERKKTLLVRRKYRPRTAMGLQQSPLEKDTVEEEQTLFLQTQNSSGKDAAETSKEKTPALRPMRASAPAGVARNKPSSWETEEMKRSTYLERQTARGKAPAVSLNKPGFPPSRSSIRQQELLAGSTSNLPSDTLRLNSILSGDTTRQNKVMGNVDNTDSSLRLGSLVSGPGTPRLRDGTPRGGLSNNTPSGTISTPRLGAATAQRTARTNNAESLMALTPRLAAGNANSNTQRDDNFLNSSNNSPSRSWKAQGLDASSSRKPAHRQAGGPGNSTEGASGVRPQGHISLIKLPSLGGTGVGGKKPLPAQGKDHVLLAANSSH